MTSAIIIEASVVRASIIPAFDSQTLILLILTVSTLAALVPYVTWQRQKNKENSHAPTRNQMGLFKKQQKDFYEQRRAVGQDETIPPELQQLYRQYAEQSEKPQPQQQPQYPRQQASPQQYPDYESQEPRREPTQPVQREESFDEVRRRIFGEPNVPNSQPQKEASKNNGNETAHSPFLESILQQQIEDGKFKISLTAAEEKDPQAITLDFMGGKPYKVTLIPVEPKPQEDLRKLEAIAKKQTENEIMPTNGKSRAKLDAEIRKQSEDELEGMIGGAFPRDEEQ